MGKVYEALTKSEKERAQSALAALGGKDGEGRAGTNTNQDLDEIDFIQYSLGAHSASELERAQHETAVAVFARRSLSKPARQVEVNIQRIDPHLVAFYDAEEPASEQYRKLAVALISAAADRPVKRMLVASAQHGEGRTCVTLNLACALAQARQRVLVVDTDLRRPSVLRLLGIEAETGMAEVIARDLQPGSAAVKVLPYGFVVLPTRERVENGVELLASPSFRDMLCALEADYDFMLFDSSPLLTSGDSGLLLRLTDATVLVIRAGKLNAGCLGKAIAALSEENIFGVVLNRAER